MEAQEGEIRAKYRDKNIRSINQYRTIGIIICKKENKFIPKRHNPRFHNS